jgi:CheY-like chemotaxis protein
LIVDDEQVILTAGRRVLEREGLSVRTAGDAETALSMMARHLPDVVVIDLKLPGMSGLEFLEVVRERFSETLVILMTGYATANHAVSSLMGGAFDYLPKPFAFQELLSPVRRAVRHRTLDPSSRAIAPDDPAGGYWCLGEIAWARQQKDGQFLLAPTPVFVATVGAVHEIAMPSGNEIIHQGGPLAKLSSEDGYVHTLWVPLSGRVVEVNERLIERPTSLDASKPETSWLVRIAATNVAAEMKVLELQV